jgi:hypothetical protein
MLELARSVEADIPTQVFPLNYYLKNKIPHCSEVSLKHSQVKAPSPRALLALISKVSDLSNEGRVVEHWIGYFERSHLQYNLLT